jgi:hypothetical protein
VTIIYKKELQEMTWSFSRAMTFKKCKYKFYLIYIEKVEKRSKFHASYGKFIHSILEKYFRREFTEQDCLDYYIENFEYEVIGNIKESTKDKLFMAGIEYFSQLVWKYDDYEILDIESEVHFKIGKYKFIGYIDVLLRHKITGDIVILDHKTGEFPLGKRGDVLKAKREEYEDYKRQIYSYSIAVYDKYGAYPKYLKWNYTRTSEELILPFIYDEYIKAQEFITDVIQHAIKEKKFEPCQSYLNCKMLCDVEHECEYNTLGGEY